MRRAFASASTADRLALRQYLVGLIALPLSLLPFLAYLTMTPEGRLVADKIRVALAPPALPTLSRSQQIVAATRAPKYQGRVMVLVYHGIGSASDGDGFVVSPKRFADHLATLKAAGMHMVTAADVADAMANKRPLPPNAVMISFDDGRADALLFADPLLEAAQTKATMFVITAAASKPGVYYAGWPQLEKAARSGRWDIEAHTDGAHHEQLVADGRVLPALTSLMPGETTDAYRRRVHADLERCNDAIAAHTGRRPTAFAYPFGAYGADRTNDPAIHDILRQEVGRQYAIAFHQDEQDSIPLAGPGAGQDRLGLRRLKVGQWTGLELLDRVAQAAKDTPGLAVGVVPPPAPRPPVPASSPATSVPRSPVALPTVGSVASASVPDVALAPLPTTPAPATPLTVPTVPLSPTPSTTPTAPPPTTTPPASTTTTTTMPVCTTGNSGHPCRTR